MAFLDTSQLVSEGRIRKGEIRPSLSEMVSEMAAWVSAFLKNFISDLDKEAISFAQSFLVNPQET